MAMSNKLRVALCLLVSQCLISPIYAHDGPAIDAVTSDGQRVLLNTDHTWDYIEHQEGDPEVSALLTVVKVTDMKDACALQLNMQNNLAFKIRSLVPRFAAYNQDDIVYETLSMSFTAIKPTRDQYKTIQFNGIGCEAISWIKVHDAGRCTMGDIDIFNEQEGQCLEHIYVAPSEDINISK